MCRPSLALPCPRVLYVVVLCLAIFATPPATAEPSSEWPQWRGPLGTGHGPGSDPPIRWSEEENIRFKVALPGHGLASPVVWDGKIFLLATEAADEAAYAASQKAAADKLERQEWPPSVEPVAQRFLVLAFSLEDGRQLWRRVAAERVPHETHYIDSSWASASPVTDGERLFAFFGSNGLFAYNLDGELLWQRDLGKMTTRNGFGEGSSPALDGETLVVNWDHEGDSFLVALDTTNGEERWRVERPDEVTSWATPVVVEVAGRRQVVVPGTGHSRGYDLASGEELWRVSGMTVNSIPTPVVRGTVVYLTSGYRGQVMQAIDLAKATGDLAGGDAGPSEALLWTHDRHTPYVPSPVLADGRICFLKHFKNIYTCLDATRGEVLFTEQRLPGITNVYASPVHAAGRIYVFGRDGAAVVLKAGDTLEVLAENQLDDGFDASPAVVGDELVVRGRKHLYAIAHTPTPAAEPSADETTGSP